MSKWIFLVKIQEDLTNHAATRFDVASVRPPGARVTEHEKKRFAIFEIEMSDAEGHDCMERRCRPQTQSQPMAGIYDGLSKEDAEAMWFALDKEAAKLPAYGLQIDFTEFLSSAKVALLGDMKKEVGFMAAPPSAIVDKTVKDK